MVLSLSEILTPQHAIDSASLTIPAPNLFSFDVNSWNWVDAGIGDYPENDGLVFTPTENLPMAPPASLVSFGLIGESSYDHQSSGVYVYEVEIDAGAVVDDVELSFKVWNPTKTIKHLESVTPTGVSGLTLGGSTDRAFGANQEVEYTVTVDQEGDATINATYQFNFLNDTNDPIVTITGNRLLVFPFPALSGVKESFEWLTDIIATYTTEQRIQLRVNPNHTIEFSAILVGNNQSKLNALVHGWGEYLFGVPIWWQSSQPGALSASDTVITFTTTYADYRAAGLALVWDSLSNYEAVTISSVASGSLTLTSGLKNSYTNPKVMPLRQGYLVQGVNQDRITDTINKNQMVFKIIDLDEVTGGSYTQYQSLDVLEDPSVSVQALKAGILRPHGFIDNKTGVPKVYTKRNVSVISDTFNSIKKTAQGRWELLQFIHARKGRAVPFWLPSWRKDFTLTANITSATITIEACEARFYESRHVMIRTTAGVVYYRQISSTGISGNDETLTLDSSLGVTVTMAEVDRISLLDKVRFNADRLQVDHEAPTITKLSVPMSTFDT